MTRPLIWLFAGISLVIWIGVFPLLVNALVPPSWWGMDARTVKIMDTVVGVSPEVTIARDVTRDYRGLVRTAIRTVVPEDSGIIPSVCRRVKEDIPYREGTPYQSHTLEWFQDVPPNAPCTLLPGQYQVEFTWERTAWWLPTVTLRHSVTSNIFTVYGSKP
jgi:hypothetical protein